MSISLGIASAGPSWRAQRLLTLARPYVDEIVLAGGAEVIDACTGLADRTLALEPGADRGRAAELLREACAGEWLLCCEDGEVPSRALLKALRELGSERRLTHYVLTTRWLYRDQASCLRSPPWQPDYRPRIVRRGAPAAGERRLLDLPLYRAELLLVAEEERRVRALALERLAPDELHDGAPAGALLLPEDWDGLVVEDVSLRDVAALAYMLDEGAVAPGEGGGGAGPEDVGGATAGAGEGGPRGPEDLAAAGGWAATAEASIAFVRPVTRMPAGIVREQEVVVRNGGDKPWPWRGDGDAPIRLGYRWRAIGPSAEPIDDGPRTLFTETVEPGRSARACLAVQAPATAGRYALEVDVVEEHVRWFGCAARLELDVEGPAAGWSAAPDPRNSYFRQARAHGLGAREALRLHRRWSATRGSDATPLSDGRPWLTFSAQDAIERALGARPRICEYGAGGSTLFALELGGDVVTIDCDADWSRRVGERIAPERRAAWTLELVAPDIDAGFAHRDPSDPDAYVSAAPGFRNHAFRSYARAIERFADGSFDLVLVAGRARPSCLRHALEKVAPGGLLVLDHSERAWYGPALALALAKPDRWTRADHRGPGPYAERFWQTTILRRTA